MSLSAESVKSRADIVAVLGHYGSVRLRNGGKAGELVGECPLPGHAKSGTQPGGAFTVTPDKQVYHCFKCGIGGDVFDLVKRIEGFSRFDQVVQHVAELIGMADDPVLAAGSGKAEHKRNPVAGETLTETLPASAPAVQGKVVATYPYVDEGGALLYEVLRYEPKGFRQRRPDGNGGWIGNLSGVGRVLYRLPEVIAADEVFFVEGERDVHTVLAGGITATTNSGGASAPWLPEYSEALRGKRVVILPDQDEPGQKHTAKIEAALQGIAADVVVVNVPTGKDVTEYLESGKTVENLLQLVAGARETKKRDEIEARGLLSPEEIYELYPGGINAFLEPRHGIKTGFHKFDEMTLGLHAGELTILAARPRMGKTALALNIAVNIAKRGHGVRFFSLEMSRESLLTRMVCAWANVDSLQFRSGELEPWQMERVKQAISDSCDLPLFLDHKTGAGLESIQRKIAASRDRGPISLVVIDYLGLMEAKSKENRTQEISELSRGLKMMARDLHLPLLVLAQLNRESEKRTDTTPQLSDLRDSGSIEQDADVVVFLSRPEVYKPNDPTLRGLAFLNVAKQRNGPNGEIRLTFRAGQTQFENYSPATEEA